MRPMTKQEAIEWAGGTQQALADKLDISAPAVSQWDAVPELQQYKLHHLSAGHLKIDPEFNLTSTKAK